MSLQDERTRAVADCLKRVREIIGRRGETRDALDDVKPALIALASRAELFPREQFPLGPNGTSKIYYLSQDPDGRFALYASTGKPGKFQPPHNHTIWAVISGVYGEEHNTLFERTDDGSVPGSGVLSRVSEIVVQKGNAVALMPNDFHTIKVTGSDSALHLHLYGRNLEDLPGRISFKDAAGGPYKVFPANPNITSPVVEPSEVKAMIGDGAELALLDVREEGVFAKGHLLFATSLPLSHLEVRLASLIPRRATRVVLYDENDGLVERAAAKLRQFGYQNVSIMSGGIAAWKDAGFEVFTGIFVPSKAFGEVVEHSDRTPSISPEGLKAHIDAGNDLVILDSRPMDEYEVMNIPGSINCPGAELAYRIFDIVKDPNTLVVVNCAGRTRSIIGAQSLINAGLPNQVFALRNGTMGWKLAGFTLEHGQHRQAPEPTPYGLKSARVAARRVAERFGVRTISLDAFKQFRNEAGERTLYVFDVRTPEEYFRGHVRDARSAPGGHLVQATDTFIGVRHARVVLTDSDGVRARMTASWLVQMGAGEIYVLDEAPGSEGIVLGNEPVTALGLTEQSIPTIESANLKNLLDRDEVVVVDLDTSRNYRKERIPCSWFAIRSRLASSMQKIPKRSLLVLTSPDGVLARLAVSEAASLTDMPVKALAGGTRAWKANGLPMETGEGRFADEDNDIWYKPYHRDSGVESAMKAYLSWEVDLIKQIKRDGDATFAQSMGCHAG